MLQMNLSLSLRLVLVLMPILRLMMMPSQGKISFERIGVVSFHN